MLQMTLCLDERHCGWMSEAVMERILNALKDRIGPKLRKEAKEGKDKVDVYRGEQIPVRPHPLELIIVEDIHRCRLANGLLLSQELFEACCVAQG